MSLLLPCENDLTVAQAKAHEPFITYILNSKSQIDYPEQQLRGLQIGSGAMESVHQIRSQNCSKRLGMTCLPETRQAIFDWRMLKLVDREQDFWRQKDLGRRLFRNWKTGTLDYQLEVAA